jgi:hypothetical protein
MPKPTNTHSEGYKHILRICNTYYFVRCNTAPQCYIIRTLSVLLKTINRVLSNSFLLVLHKVLYFLHSISFIKTSPHFSAALCTTENVNIWLFEQILNIQVLWVKTTCEMHVCTNTSEQLSNSIFRVVSTTINMEAASSSNTLYVLTTATTSNPTILTTAVRTPNFVTHLQCYDLHIYIFHTYELCVISGFRLVVDENCVLLDSWPLKMRPIGCPEASVRNCHYSLRNRPEERSSHLRISSPKSRLFVHGMRFRKVASFTLYLHHWQDQSLCFKVPSVDRNSENMFPFLTIILNLTSL